jgi:hypothetical protein
VVSELLGNNANESQKWYIKALVSRDVAKIAVDELSQSHKSIQF